MLVKQMNGKKKKKRQKFQSISEILKPETAGVCFFIYFFMINFGKRRLQLAELKKKK